MENKHTQGRWYLQKYTDVYTNIIRCDNGKGNETIYIANLHGEGCNNRANAKLIAAAPDLLEALQTCWASLQTYGEHPIIERQVENAIKKAI